jgi:uncharacterized protein (DUF342 family)
MDASRIGKEIWCTLMRCMTGFPNDICEMFTLYNKNSNKINSRVKRSSQQLSRLRNASSFMESEVSFPVHKTLSLELFEPLESTSHISKYLFLIEI